MSFNISVKETGSVNDSAQKLKLGKNKYTIKSAKLEVNKFDPTGKEQQIVITLDAGNGYNVVQRLAVNSDNEITAKMAAQNLVGFAVAAGITAKNLKPEHLKALVGKDVFVTEEPEEEQSEPEEEETEETEEAEEDAPPALAPKKPRKIWDED